MRLGMSPTLAALDAMRRMVSKLPDFVGAVIAMDPKGNHGAACHNLPNGFPYCHRNASLAVVEVITVDCSDDLGGLDAMIADYTSSEKGVYLGFPTLFVLLLSIF